MIAEPYLGRAPRALADKLRVLDRGSDMVLAAHFTPLGGRLGLVAETVETVRFTRPERVDFRLVRGPVPHVVEALVISELARRTAALDRAQDDVDGRERAADERDRLADVRERAADQRDRDAFQRDRKASETE